MKTQLIILLLSGIIFSCSKLDSRSRSIASIIDKSPFEQKQFAKKRFSEIAQRLMEQYPSDEYFVLGWGINSNAIIGELNELSDDDNYTQELPVTKMKAIYPEGFSEKGYTGNPLEYEDKLFTLKYRRKKLLERILPSKELLKGRTLVIYRALWAGNTFASFMPDVIAYMQENGYQLPLNIEVLSDAQWRGESIINTLKVPEIGSEAIVGDSDKIKTLKKINSMQSYQFNIEVDRDLSTLITNEVRDFNFGSHEYNQMVREQYTPPKLGLLDNSVYRSVSAMEIIQHENWTGFPRRNSSACLDKVEKLMR